MTPIHLLQRRLHRLADPSKKAWWEAYLKGAIGFRGVPMAGVRREVAAWLPAEGRVALALLVREGSVLAPSLASWRDGFTLWQRRAAIVAFVKLAPRGDDNWPGFTDALLESCASNVLDEARFSQTGVGWVLRELSKADPARVEAFAVDHPLSTEARRMALAKITGRGRR